MGCGCSGGWPCPPDPFSCPWVCLSLWHRQVGPWITNPYSRGDPAAALQARLLLADPPWAAWVGAVEPHFAYI